MFGELPVLLEPDGLASVGCASVRDVGDGK